MPLKIASMNVFYVNASEIDNGDNLVKVNACFWKFLVQGDSWFSIGGSVGVPWIFPPNGNVLSELDMPKSTALVTSAYPGKTLETMVDWSHEVNFSRLLETGHVLTVNAILLSGSGNDFISAININPRTADPALQRRRILLGAHEWTNEPGMLKYVSKNGWRDFLDRLTGYYVELARLRDSTNQNRGIPIVTHSYDYAMPRNAPVHVGLKTYGPWLLPALKKHDIPEADYAALVVHFLDGLREFQRTLGDRLRKLGIEHPNIHSVDFHGALTKAPPSSTGRRADWENEIHPTKKGYEKLAQILRKDLLDLVRH